MMSGGDMSIHSQRQHLEALLRHGGFMVTVPISDRGGLGFSSHPGGFFSSQQVVYTGVEECHGG